MEYANVELELNTFTIDNIFETRLDSELKI